MIRSIQFKLDPTPSQKGKLQFWLDRCRNLYNALLEQRILSYKQSKTWGASKLATRYGQTEQLPELKEECPEFSEVNSQVLQDVCGRIDKTFKAFFKRNKTIKTGGFPRFKSYQRFNSFTHPQASETRLDLFNREFRLPSFGWIKFHLNGQDAPEGSRPKTATFKKLPDGWWLTLTVEIPDSQRVALPPTGKVGGLDMGLKAFVTTDSGLVLGDLAPIKKAEKKIRLTQRDLSRKKLGSNRRRKCRAILAKQNLRLTRAKDLQSHTISRKLVEEFDVIVVEDLDIKGMLGIQQGSSPMSSAGRRGLRRNIGLASWGKLIWQLDYKAEDAGRLLIKVDPRGTSQSCSQCGTVPLVKKTLKDRTHHCLDCGVEMDRDQNAARNVLHRGLDMLQNGRQSPVVNSVGNPSYGQKREVGNLAGLPAQIPNFDKMRPGQVPEEFARLGAPLARLVRQQED